MADKIFTVLSDGNAFDGIGGTEVVIVKDEFADRTNAATFNDVATLVGDKNMLTIHLDELIGDVCAVATGVIPRELFDARINKLICEVERYLERDK